MKLTAVLAAASVAVVNSASISDSIYDEICKKDACLTSYCPEGMENDIAVAILSEFNQENVEYYYNAVQFFRNRICDIVVEKKTETDSIVEMIASGIEDPHAELAKYGFCGGFDNLNCYTDFIHGHINNLDYALEISPYTVVAVNTTMAFDDKDDSSKVSRRQLFAPASSLSSGLVKPVIIGTQVARQRASKMMNSKMTTRISASMSSGNDFNKMSSDVFKSSMGRIQPLSKFTNNKLDMSSTYGKRQQRHSTAMSAMMDAFNSMDSMNDSPYPLTGLETLRELVVGEFDNFDSIMGVLSNSIYGNPRAGVVRPYAKKFVTDITDHVVRSNEDLKSGRKVFFTHEVICFNTKAMDMDREYGFGLSKKTPCVRSIVEYREMEDGQDCLVRKYHVPLGYTAMDNVILDQLHLKVNFQQVKTISYSNLKAGKSKPPEIFMHTRATTIDSVWQTEEVYTLNGITYYRQSSSKLGNEGMSLENLASLPNNEIYAEFTPFHNKEDTSLVRIEEELKYPTESRAEIDNVIDPVSPDAAVFNVKKVTEEVSDPPRKFAIGGNWKANGNVESVKELVKILNTGSGSDNVDVLVFPPAIFLGYVKENLNSGNYLVGAQNVAKDCFGAYTGEVCAPMLKDFGIDWTIVGHSERRAGFGAEGESNDLVAEKCKTSIDNGVNIVPCVGETLEDRENDHTMDVIIEQLKPIADALDLEDWDKVILAYEPVWAIGTGLVATPEQAQEVHQHIREWIAENVSKDVAKSLRIQYGGSVKGESAATLIEQPDIDGFLVGGASLTDDFLTIINAANTYEKNSNI